MRIPIASQIALASAGAIAGVPGSTCTTNSITAVDDESLYLRGLVHTNHVVIMEVALCNRTTMNLYLAVEVGS